MLKTRVLTVLVLAPPFLYIVWRGGIPFLCLVAFMALMGMVEYLQMLAARGIPASRCLGLVMVGAMFAILPLAGERGVLAVATLGPMLLIGRWFAAGAIDGALVANALTAYGVLAFALPLAFLVLLRFLPAGQGDAYTYMLIALIWVQDSAAYFAGRALGRHKLSPLISPKKTWEGTIVGLAAGVGAAVVLAVHLHVVATPALTAGLGLVAVAAQLGDLNESLVKRNLGVKDSGGLIPGHGGVLDRFDSFTYAAPVMYYVVRATI